MRENRRVRSSRTLSAALVGDTGSASRATSSFAGIRGTGTCSTSGSPGTCIDTTRASTCSFHSDCTGPAVPSSDNDGTLVAAAGVTEPINLPTTASGSGNKINVFDFKIQDGGGGDGFTLDVSEIRLNLTGTASGNFSKLRFGLSGCATRADIAPSGTTVTFSGLTVSVADGGSTTCTVSAYWNDNTGITDNQTLTLGIDGDTDLTINTSKTTMTGTNTNVSTGAMATSVTATKLAFSTAPSSGDASGLAMTPFAVSATDAVGNVDTDYSTNVNVSKSAGLGAVSGTTTVAPVSGVATFSNVVYTATTDGESFALAADSGAFTTITSSALLSDVVATQLVFSPAPTSGDTSGAAMTSFAVRAANADGTIDTDHTSNVVISKNAGSGAISGTTTVAATSGVATFSNVVYSAAADGESYVLDADSAALPTLTSASLTADVVATRLAFSTAPTSGNASGQTMTSFAVAGVDANGTVDSAYSLDITVSKSSGAGAVSGTTTVTPTSGVATFSNVVYTAVNDNESFALSADDSVFTTLTSNALLSDVVATKLLFATQPSPLSLTSGAALDFTTDPVVRAVNADNAVDTDYATSIVLSEINGAGSATMTVTGDTDGNGSTVTLSPTSGAVTFTGLTLTYTNSGSSAETFNLQATSGGLTAASSSQLSSGIPSITSATYNAGTGVLVVTGSSYVANGSGADVDASTLTLLGEGGATYTLTDTADVELNSPTQFTLTLSATDRAAIGLILNKDGTLSTDITTYTLSAADNWLTDASLTSDISDPSNPVTVSNVPIPTITSATLNLSTGVLAVTGTGFSSRAGAANDIDVTKLVLSGEDGSTHTLTSASVEVTSTTAFSVTLNASDQAAVTTFLNKNGTLSTGGATYNLNAQEDWARGADAALNVADALNGVTVSNVAPSAITSATYNVNTGTLVVTGTGLKSLTGLTNDIDASLLTFTGEGGATYQLTSTADVEITSATSFTVTLDATDNAAVAQIVNKAGTSSTGGTTYNLAAAEDWATGDDLLVNVADASNAVTASGVPTPTLTAAAYDASTGVLTVTGTAFTSLAGANNDIDLTKLTLTGEGGASYTLTSSAVDITSPTEFSVTLNAADRQALGPILNKAGATSTSGTTYNLAAADDWAAGADAAVNVADLTGNGVTVSNVAAPTITSATYDAASKALTVTGTGFPAFAGAGNDIDVTKLTIAGEGGGSHTLAASSNVDITSATSFTVTLSGLDITSINGLLTKDGTAAEGGATYNLAAAEDWATGADAAANIADLTGNGITVSNFAVPAISSATYDHATGQLTVTGTRLASVAGATNDIDASRFTITGEGGAAHTLAATANLDVVSETTFTLALGAADRAAVDTLLNKNGTTSTGATTYNLAALEDWSLATPAALTVADVTGNGITVSNVPLPTITSANYDGTTGVLVVTGTGMPARAGAANDIDLSQLRFTGKGGASYTLTTTSDVEVTSSTSFTATLAGADLTGVNALLDQNGTSASDSTAYNLAALEDWATGADVAQVIADLSGNAITVGNAVDSDGIANSVEDSVPNPSGGGTGDGNGDSIPDSQQNHVASLATAVGGAMATIAAEDGTTPLTGVAAQAAPVDPPTNVTFPYGLFSFTLTSVAPGATETVTLFVPANSAINGYWKKNTLGNWVNIATSVSQVGNKTRIMFPLTESGLFDFDANATTITDPGGPGIFAGATAIPTLSEWGMMLLVSLMGLGAALSHRRRID
ncbi:MAG: IPTL-CTERM sorting domain-containing protein [Rhodocyclaceae bacterium]|nr:IPTL-CTERM sorting domain-containing protein [Rhodocyclaceae bacterium]